PCTEDVIMLATTLNCPDCGAVLKLADPVPAGKKIKCPKCTSVFAVPAREEPARSAIRANGDSRLPIKKKPGSRDDVHDDYEVIRPKSKAVTKPRVDDDYDRDRDRDRDEDYDRDDDYDAPRRKKKKKGKPVKSGGKGLLIGLLIGGLVFVLGGTACAL